MSFDVNSKIKAMIEVAANQQKLMLEAATNQLKFNLEGISNQQRMTYYIYIIKIIIN